MSKKKIQIGNYLVSKEGNEVERIKIESVSNNWNMKVPSFNSQFKLFEYLANDESKHKYFESYINIMYITANMMPDMEFIQDYANAYDALVKRQSESVKQSEEQDKEEIENAKNIYNMQKEEIDE